MKRIAIVISVIAAFFSGEIVGQDIPLQIILDSPQDGAENVLMDEDLIWFGDTDATEYEIQIADNAGLGGPVVEEILTDTSFTLQGQLDFDTQYFWRVRGVNDEGDGSWSETWGFTTIVDEPGVVDLSEPADESEDLTTTPALNWAASENAESYQVEISTNSSFTDIIRGTEISGTEYTVTEALPNGSTFFWRVRAINEAGESDWSEIWSFTTIVDQPDVITLVSPPNNATGVSINPGFEWEVMEEADSYNFQLATDAGFNDLVTEESGLESTTTGLEEVLENNTQYYWRVRGVNSGGEGDWSDVWNFTTVVNQPGIVNLISPPDNATGVSINPDFEWQALEGTVGYDFQIAADEEFNNLVTEELDIESTTISLEETLENDTQYYWRVRGVNSGGNGEWSEAWSFTTIIEVPEIVILEEPVNESENVSTTPAFTWNASERADTYELELSASANFTESTMYRDITSTEFTLQSGLSNGTIYHWRVRAINEGGESEWSEVWNFTTAISLPGMIDLISPTNGETGIELDPVFEWQVSGSADSYDFQLATDSDFNSLIIDDSDISSTTNSPDISLDFNTQYYWRVRGVNDGGEGSWSEPWNFTTIIEAPGMAVLSEPANNADNISTFPTLRWNSAERAESYQVELSANAGFSDIIEAEVVGGTEFSVDDGLENEATYYWRVRALNDGGESEWSDIWNFTTIVSQPNMVSLESPTNGTTGLELSPEFEWQVLDGAESYAFQLATDSNFNNIEISATGIGATSLALDESLDYNTQYYWRVRAENEAGDGPWSEAWNFTTIIAQPGITQLSQPVNNSESISTFPTLEWNEAARAESYLLELSANVEFSDTIIDTVLSDTAYSVNNRLTRGAAFYWRVKTLNAGGESDWSETWNFTTILEPPMIVQLVEPENNAADISRTPRLTWFSVALAEEYLVEVATSNAFSELVFDTTFAAPDTSYIFEKELEADTKYYWTVKAVNDGGSSDWSEVFSFTTEMSTSIEDESMPVEFTLQQNYPNPFNPTTNIRYGIPEASDVKLEVFNTLGQKVSTLVNERKSAGWHTSTFDASRLASGMYIYRITAKDFVSTKKLMLIK
ncbi:MAG: T9SS type A sorting domain-containing protein [Balneolaceae bacterium]